MWKLEALVFQPSRWLSVHGPRGSVLRKPALAPGLGAQSCSSPTTPVPPSAPGLSI